MDHQSALRQLQSVQDALAFKRGDIAYVKAELAQEERELAARQEQLKLVDEQVKQGLRKLQALADEHPEGETDSAEADLAHLRVALDEELESAFAEVSEGMRAAAPSAEEVEAERLRLQHDKGVREASVIFEDEEAVFRVHEA